jgi:AcrR family transcriptional regulator
MPDSDQPPERGRAVRRAQKTRKRLLEAALSVFTQQGVDACSIEDITELADVGKGTFYRHFHDKAAILCTLTEAALLDLSTLLRDRVSNAGSLPEALDRIQTSEAGWCLKQAEGFRLLLQVQALLVVRPKALVSLHAPFRALVAGMEAVLRPLAPATTDEAALRRLVIGALATPFGTLALQQAMQDGEPRDAAEAAYPAIATVLATPIKNVGPSSSGGTPSGG